jgi:hypothetical protein
MEPLVFRLGNLVVTHRLHWSTHRSPRAGNVPESVCPTFWLRKIGAFQIGPAARDMGYPDTRESPAPWQDATCLGMRRQVS